MLSSLLAKGRLILHSQKTSSQASLCENSYDHDKFPGALVWLSVSCLAHAIYAFVVCLPAQSALRKTTPSCILYEPDFSNGDTHSIHNTLVMYVRVVAH
jgi:hypothetical protein